MAEFEPHICDVCRLLDGDFRLKLCMYCRACGSWICELDLDDWARRVRAARKKVAESLMRA